MTVYEKRSGAISVSWGRSGGFYVHRGASAWRLCLGRVAVTWWRAEIDDLIRSALGGAKLDAPTLDRIEAVVSGYRPFRVMVEEITEILADAGSARG